ncbi:aminotransferase class III-fold pyridoxal phosphate-dependent enzyme, partial [Acidimicrobiaceae bacterium USS-CC1]|nr:aminotransferase class III-fold pyridoxal phosphate-dependent enzyme [Acidiferrimicrobium australe]
MTGGLLFAAAFLACAVEAVEATTVVLAVGVTRSWRSSWRGVLAGVVVLAVIVAALGPAISQIPLGPLRLVVGGLLLVFGLGWLRKAILRASGHKSLHDEASLYEKHLAEAREAGASSRRRGVMGPDAYAFTLSFKAVVLEGLEVAFIVVTFGANAKQVPLAALAAVAAIAAVVALAIAVRAPLARVPENTIKFAVGVLLSSFGTFWGAEGAGAHWPANDGSLLWLIPVMMNAGIIPPVDGYLAGLGDLLRAHGALLTFDEVKTGLTVGPGGA